MGGAYSTYGERIGVYRLLVEKPEGKRPLGRGEEGRIILRWLFRCGMWKHGLDRAGSGYGKWRTLVNVVMNFRVP